MKKVSTLSDQASSVLLLVLFLRIGSFLSSSSTPTNKSKLTSYFARPESGHLVPIANQEAGHIILCKSGHWSHHKYILPQVLYEQKLTSNDQHWIAAETVHTTELAKRKEMT